MGRFLHRVFGDDWGVRSLDGYAAPASRENRDAIAQLRDGHGRRLPAARLRPPGGHLGRPAPTSRTCRSARVPGRPRWRGSRCIYPMWRRVPAPPARRAPPPAPDRDGRRRRRRPPVGPNFETARRAGHRHHHDHGVGGARRCGSRCSPRPPRASATASCSPPTTRRPRWPGGSGRWAARCIVASVVEWLVGHNRALAASRARGVRGGRARPRRAGRAEPHARGPCRRAGRRPRPAGRAAALPPADAGRRRAVGRPDPPRAPPGARSPCSSATSAASPPSPRRRSPRTCTRCSTGTSQLLGDHAQRHGATVGRLHGRRPHGVLQRPAARSTTRRARRSTMAARAARRRWTTLLGRWRRVGHDIGFGVGIALGLRQHRHDRLRGPPRLHRARPGGEPGLAPVRRGALGRDPPRPPRRRRPRGHDRPRASRCSCTSRASSARSRPCPGCCPSLAGRRSVRACPRSTSTTSPRTAGCSPAATTTWPRSGLGRRGGGLARRRRARGCTTASSPTTARSCAAPRTSCRSTTGCAALLTTGPMLADGVGAARRAGGALQGEDQLQAARRRRLRAAPGRARLPVRRDATCRCMVAVDDALVGNGCLEVVSGRHHELLPMDDAGCIRADVVAALDWAPVRGAGGRDALVPLPHAAPQRAQPRADAAPGAVPHLQRAGRGRPAGRVLRAEARPSSPRAATGDRVPVSLIGDFQGRPVR